MYASEWGCDPWYYTAARVIASDWRPPPQQRLVDYSEGPPSKGWIAQMDEHWYGNPEVSGSSPGPVKFSLPIFQNRKKKEEGKIVGKI